uniref:Uncharacterized protein n=1 Tax=Palpitomonas bilix TaxID=652834 RepID=A0A7S3D0Z8_9EUKA|mmetsp:Transcript_17495/g.43623  ORF Transcript_17495/g.43623 Transcript_17495/m.43623 type:complete len:247 (+) Transcript_17495:495-1235(+)
MGGDNESAKKYLSRSLPDPLHRYDDAIFHPARRIPINVNKPQYANSTIGIDGSSPLKRTERIDTIWSNYAGASWKDLPGRQTRRCVNPLNPVYPLPSFKPETAPSPPARRNPLLIEDIPGTRKKDVFEQVYNIPGSKVRDGVRDPLRVGDIEGASPYRHFSKAERKSHWMDVNDVVYEKPPFRKTTRHVSPLDPAYSFGGKALDKQNDFTRPRTHVSQGRQIGSLRTDDIEGESQLFFSLFLPAEK